LKTHVGKGASLGANSTILANIKIGQYSMVGAGSLVTKDVPEFALVYGSPASIKGWVDKNGKKLIHKGQNKWASENGETFKVVDNKLFKCR
jgi:UDP-2-acetamido-3-amino-2,3-dideoxy-glucuronate N-acetyltransferase